ncbi:MAG: hypothetical protein QM743_10475 [Chitinophagaceae bacterium]
MLAGLYRCDSGLFAPDTAFMLSSNYISTTYVSPYYSQAVTMVATVDADTFRNRFFATGLDVPAVLHTTGVYKFIRIPPTVRSSIQASGDLQNVRAFDLSGRLVVQPISLKR